MNKQNQKMLKLKEQFPLSIEGYPSFFSKIENLNILKVKDCFIISNKVFTVTDEKFEKLLKMCGGRTGYEASNNELRVIDYLGEEIDLSEQEQYLLGQFLVQSISKILRKQTKEPIHFIFSFDDSVLTIRFHMYRSVEGSWLSSNLEGYREAVEVFTVE